MSGFHGHGVKRRDPEDELQELRNLSLSPPKKLRIVDSGASPSSGPSFNFSPRSGPETGWGFSPTSPAWPTPVAATDPVPSQPVVQQEKALVLYKPVTPPMFPGGAPAVAVDFPNSATRPIQALDLSNGPVAYIGRKQLQRVSSCSSLPRFTLNEDQVMVEEIDKSADLAVIPWIPMTPLVAPQVRPIIEEVEEDSPIDQDGAQMLDEDIMDIVDADQVVVTEDGMTSMTGQFGGPMPSINAAPWQAEVLQPPFTTPMWSH